jgi:hypothetical protein
VAVLDPFPVGLHLPILEALLDGVPVVSAPALQVRPICRPIYSLSSALSTPYLLPI